MVAVPITLLDVIDPVDSPRLSHREGSVQSTGDAQLREWERCVVLQLAMCGAIANRDTIEFARAVAEIFIWSAEHARTAAAVTPAIAADQPAEWQCNGCGETVPGNFDICWQCERGRDD